MGAGERTGRSCGRNGRRSFEDGPEPVEHPRMRDVHGVSGAPGCASGDPDADGVRRGQSGPGRRRAEGRVPGAVVVTTSVASHVLIGTDATSPIDPTRARTISIATISRVVTLPTGSLMLLNSNNSGRAAPA